MKKFRRITYIILIAIIVVLSFTVYTNASKKDGDNDKKKKTLSEIEYIENKVTKLLNTMNNIETRNYMISAGELSKQATSKTSKQGSSSQSSSSGGGQSDSSGGSSGDGGSNSAEGTAATAEGEAAAADSKEDQKKFDMKLSGVLTNKQDINWDKVKGEIEILYTSIPTLTLDLYQLGVDKQEVLNFNQEFDNLVKSVKDEKKEETLAELSKLYDFMPKFTDKATDENLKKGLTETKSNIFKAYSKLDGGDWKAIGDDVQNAINSYNKIMTDTNINPNKQYDISKGYVMINELQNAVKNQDTSIFLIKYKNLIEEIDNI